MVVRNRASRYHLVMDALNNARRTAAGRERPDGLLPVAAGRATRSTSSRTSRTCPRCATGCWATGPSRAEGVAAGTGSVLVLNGGSSSVKVALVDPATGERALTALAEKVGTSDAVGARGGVATTSRRRRPSDTSPSGVIGAPARRADGGRSATSVVGVGHRVVHGGRRFTESVVVDDSVMAELGRAHRARAAAHAGQPARPSRPPRRLLPDATAGAVFDTAFHRTLPPVAYRYAVPTEWYERARRPALRLPRHQPPLRRAPRRRDAGPTGRSRCGW